MQYHPEPREASYLQAVEVIHDLADYAHARNLDVADELLTELLSVFHSRLPAASRHGMVHSQSRALTVLRLMCEPDLPDDPRGGSESGAVDPPADRGALLGKPG